MTTFSIVADGTANPSANEIDASNFDLNSLTTANGFANDLASGDTILVAGSADSNFDIKGGAPTDVFTLSFDTAVVDTLTAKVDTLATVNMTLDNPDTASALELSDVKIDLSNAPAGGAVTIDSAITVATISPSDAGGNTWTIGDTVTFAQSGNLKFGGDAGDPATGNTVIIGSNFNAGTSDFTFGNADDTVQIGDNAQFGDIKAGDGAFNLKIGADATFEKIDIKTDSGQVTLNIGEGANLKDLKIDAEDSKSLIIAQNATLDKIDIKGDGISTITIGDGTIVHGDIKVSDGDDDQPGGSTITLGENVTVTGEIEGGDANDTVVVATTAVVDEIDCEDGIDTLSLTFGDKIAANHNTYTLGDGTDGTTALDDPHLLADLAEDDSWEVVLGGSGDRFQAEILKSLMRPYVFAQARSS